MTHAQDVCQFERELCEWFAAKGFANFVVTAQVGNVEALASELESIRKELPRDRSYLQNAFSKLVDQFEKHMRLKSAGGPGIPFTLTAVERSTCISMLFYLLAMDLRKNDSGERALLIDKILNENGPA